MLRTLMSFLLLIFNTFIYGVTIFVAPYGDDNSATGSMDNPFQNVQTAIDASTDGDLIWLSIGTYDGDCNIGDKKISVTSAFSSNLDTNAINQTIINGVFSSSSNNNNESAYEVIISGFTLVGKFYFHNSTATLVSMNITGPDHGVKMFFGNVTILLSKISNNEESGIYAEYSNLNVSNSLISKNSEKGVWIRSGISGSSYSFNNCSIVKNEDKGIYRFNFDNENGRIHINNSIIYKNNSAEFYSYGLSSDSIFINNSNIPGVWGSSGDIGEFLPANLFGIGNINANPLFCDFDNDNYYLAANSPSLGMGAFVLGCENLYPDRTVYVDPMGMDNVATGSEQYPFQSIQAAINYASPGDTVLVKPGHYVENISDEEGINLTIGSLFLIDQDTSHISETIIDGTGGHTVVSFSTADSSSKFMGFKIINGNSALGGGGLGFHSYSCPTVSNLIIHGNYGHRGGGIWTRHNSSPLIVDVLIDSNEAYKGGGIAITGNSNPTLTNSILRNNSSTSSGTSTSGGGAVFIDNSSNVIINNCVINNNTTANNRGSALFITDDSNVLIENSTIVNNVGTDSWPEYYHDGYDGEYEYYTGWWEGGSNEVYLYGGDASLQINNSIVWNDGIYISAHNYATWTSSNCNFMSIPNSENGENNINSNPLFCNIDIGDFSLAENSPCLGVGINGANIGAYNIGCGELFGPVFGIIDDIQIVEDQWGEGIDNDPVAKELNIQNINGSIIQLDAWQEGMFYVSLDGVDTIDILENVFQLFEFTEQEPYELTYSFPNDVYGYGYIGISVSNQLGSDTTSFKVNIQPVNDSPSIINQLDDITLEEDSEGMMITINASADGHMIVNDDGEYISESGGGYENDQILTVFLSSNNENIVSFLDDTVFTLQFPYIGEFTYDFVEDAYGSAQVTVSVVDNGGTDNGGLNFTDVSFIINVDPVNDPPNEFSTIFPTINDTLSINVDSDEEYLFYWNASKDIDSEVIYNIDWGLEDLGNEWWFDGISDTSYSLQLAECAQILTDLNISEKVLWYIIYACDDQECVSAEDWCILKNTTLEIDGDVIPELFALHQNYPNPFNPRTEIRYDLPKSEFVNINIYDVMGRKIKSLIDINQEAGYRSISWNATNDLGQPVSAGMYIYTIQAGEFMQTKKMVLLK